MSWEYEIADRLERLEKAARSYLRAAKKAQADPTTKNILKKDAKVKALQRMLDANARDQILD